MKGIFAFVGCASAAITSASPAGALSGAAFAGADYAMVGDYYYNESNEVCGYQFYYRQIMTLIDEDTHTAKQVWAYTDLVYSVGRKEVAGGAIASCEDDELGTVYIYQLGPSAS